MISFYLHNVAHHTSYIRVSTLPTLSSISQELKNKDRISEDEWVSGSMVQTKIVPPEMLENFMLPQIMATLEQMREKLKDNSSSE